MCARVLCARPACGQHACVVIDPRAPTLRHASRGGDHVAPRPSRCARVVLATRARGQGPGVFGRATAVRKRFREGGWHVGCGIADLGVLFYNMLWARARPILREDPPLHFRNNDGIPSLHHKPHMGTHQLFRKLSCIQLGRSLRMLKLVAACLSTRFMHSGGEHRHGCGPLVEAMLSAGRVGHCANGGCLSQRNYSMSTDCDLSSTRYEVSAPHLCTAPQSLDVHMHIQFITYENNACACVPATVAVVQLLTAMTCQP